MVKNYIPEKGDIVWVNLDPAMGHEQKGRRPAVVVSATDYNNKTGLCLACPTTKVLKPYPFYVNLSKEQKTKGSVLSDQVKSIDCKERKVVFIEKMNEQTLTEVTKKISILIS